MNLKYDTLVNLRIHELRDLARSIGVKSPTSKKKEEIINDILLILSGKSEPYVNETKQGRPAKSALQVNDNLVDFFVPKDQIELSGNMFDNYNVSGDDGFMDLYAFSPAAKYNSGFSSSSNDTESGYLDIHQNGFGIIRVNGFMPNENDVFVNIYDIKKHNLKTGDYINGEVQLVQAGKPRVLVKVISINNKLSNYIESSDRFEEYDYETQSTPVKVSAGNSLSDFFAKNNNMCEGGRSLVLSDGLINYTGILNFIKSINNKYKVYLINLNAKPEEKSYVDDNLEVVSVMFSQPENVQYSVSNLVLEKAKRDVENNNQVIVVINKLSVLIKAINNLYSQEYSSVISMQTVHRIKDILMSAKNVNEKQNLTLVVFDSMLEKQNIKDFILHDLGQLFNSITTIIHDKNGDLKYTIL